MAKYTITIIDDPTFPGDVRRNFTVEQSFGAKESGQSSPAEREFEEICKIMKYRDLRRINGGV